MSTGSEAGTPGRSTAERREAAIADYLAGRPQHACFVSELRAALDLSSEEIEAGLNDLTEDGVTVVQHNFCADPHFIDADLRVVALVPAGGDGEAQAAAACERLWQRWTADFLASHRCM